MKQRFNRIKEKLSELPWEDWLDTSWQAMRDTIRVLFWLVALVCLLSAVGICEFSKETNGMLVGILLLLWLIRLDFSLAILESRKSITIHYTHTNTGGEKQERYYKLRLWQD